VAIDFDNTICHNSGLPDFLPTESMEGAIEAIKYLVNKGLKIIIHTARPWSDYELVENFLNKHEIPFRRIVCGKLLARFYIDDRGVEYNGDWLEVLEKLDKKIGVQ